MSNIQLIAGPCSIESEEQFEKIAVFLKENGVEYIRAGAFKPRTKPTSFQGLEREGILIMDKLKKKYNFKIVSEIMSEDDVMFFDSNVDIIQVGARNMQNYSLLKKLSRMDKIIMLKRGFGCTVKELLGSADYLKQNGNNDVILCERGIRTFEDSYRFTLDISAVVLLKQTTDYKVFVDPSHASGRPDLIVGLSKAAIAAGCDGLMVEVHYDKLVALSDGFQSLNFEEFLDFKSKI